MISDQPSASQQFYDQDIQDSLDVYRSDIRYLLLDMAPTIVNNANTSNQSDIIYADFYSTGYTWWESDIVLQANHNGQAWAVVTPVASDYITGHFQFELDVFNTGTVPGQIPPVFATGKVYDLYAASADLLDMWAATLAGSFDFSSDGQSFKSSQLMQAKITLASMYRRRAKPMVAKLRRSDVAREMSSTQTPILDSAIGA